MPLGSKVTTSCNGFEHHSLITFCSVCIGMDCVIWDQNGSMVTFNSSPFHRVQNCSGCLNEQAVGEK
jgi:hypothetical protein